MLSHHWCTSRLFRVSHNRDLVYTRCKVTLPALAVSFCLYTQSACCAGRIILLLYTIRQPRGSIHIHHLACNFITLHSHFYPTPPLLFLSILCGSVLLSIILCKFYSSFSFNPLICLEGLYHGQSEFGGIFTSLRYQFVFIHTRIYIQYISISFSRLEICKCLLYISSSLEGSENANTFDGLSLAYLSSCAYHSQLLSSAPISRPP